MSIKQTFLKQHSLKGELVVDQHLHCGLPGSFLTRGADFSTVEGELERLGVRAGIVSDINAHDDPKAGNDRVQAIAEASGGRIFGAIFLSANDPQGFESEIEKRVSSGWFTSFKMHPSWAGRDVDDPFYKGVYRIAGELGWPVLVHTWGCRDIGLMERLAREFPATVFLVGHCGGELDASLRAGELAREYENFYLDFTCSWGYANLPEYLVRTCGASKILYGSDALWNSMTASLGRIIFADISDEDKRLILGGNAARLFPKLHGIRSL